MLTRDPRQAPNTPGEVTIGFEAGIPVSVNGQHALSGVGLIEQLNDIAGQHGVGRIDLVENRFVGMKSRGCYETPGGTLIVAALRELEALTLDRATLHFKQKLAIDYADLVYNGLWFTPLRVALDAFFAEINQPNTGEITLRLYKGTVEPVSRVSPNSLYSLKIASFAMGADYDQKDARGFINLIGLPIQVRAALRGQTE
jgi:argininosuccinate synthase